MPTLTRETIDLGAGVRLLPFGRTACSVCDADVRLVQEHPGRRRTRLIAGVHGPRQDRCSGSRLAGKPWVLGSHLPTWVDMSDRDKGQALMFAHKCWWEQSYQYARENYPPRYEHPLLAQMGAMEPVNSWSARHASGVVAMLGERLDSVPNFWAQYSSGNPFARLPSRVPEPSIEMARRILGEAEVQRLMELAGGKF